MYSVRRLRRLPRWPRRPTVYPETPASTVLLRHYHNVKLHKAPLERNATGLPASHLYNTINGILKDREARSARRRLAIASHDAVDFSSNDFLSLTKSKELRVEYFAELASATHMPLGSGSSRLLDGNSKYIEDIENDLASFYRGSSGLLFNSGFDANSGFFSCVPQPGDIIVYDEHIHASVHDGMRLSRARDHRKFQHNSARHFAEVLRALVREDEAVKRGKRNVFVAVESVYSMDGDIAPIKEILDIIDATLPLANGHLIVDEAHSSGVYGPQGRGVVCELGVEDRLLARLHTFGKALASNGAIIFCHPLLREYLINYARSLIYTTALGLPTLAAIKSVHKFMIEGKTEEPRRRLWNLVNYFQDRIQTLPENPFVTIPEGPPKSPIFSLCSPDPRSLAGVCQQVGFVVRAIMPPTVPKGGQRVRVCLHSENTEQEIDRLVDIISTWLATKSSEMHEQTAEAPQRSHM